MDSQSASPSGERPQSCTKVACNRATVIGCSSVNRFQCGLMSTCISIVMLSAGTPSSSFSLKSPTGKSAGFRSVASAVLQSQSRRTGDDAAVPGADSKAASQSRLFAGTASSEAKRREMLLRAQKEAAGSDDGMVRISPEDLAAMRAEIAALRESVQKLQPLDPENAQLKRNMQALQ